MTLQPNTPGRLDPRRRITKRFVLGALAAALIAAPGNARADSSVEDFYRGKQLQFVIGYGPGGGYDLYARFVARFLGDYIPGKPTIIARNMPGGGGRLATAYVFANAPQDGTVLLTADQSLVLDQALGDPGIRFDLRKLAAVGNPNAESNNLVTWHTSGIKTIADARTREVTVGAAPGASMKLPLVMNGVLKTRFKPVLGYNGGNEINIAMERGEVDGRGQNSFAAWKASKPDWIAENRINFIVQWGANKVEELPDVPLLTDLASNPDDRRMFQIFTAPTQLGRPIFTTPNVPKARIAALRQAFEAMVKDPAFIEAARKANIDLNPVFGKTMEEAVMTALDTPEPILNRMRTIVTR